MKEFKEGYLKKVTRNSPIRWKNWGFTMLPNSLMFNEKVGRSGLLVYWSLTVHLFKGKEYCFPSIRTICVETRYSKSTVLRAIAELEQNSYLKVDRTPGEVSHYKLLM